MLNASSRLFRVANARYYATHKSPLSSTELSLDVPWPGFESQGESETFSAKENIACSTPFASQVTGLDSGLRVATQRLHGEFVTIGVAIESGSRYEAEFPKGTSHFLEKLAFGGTAEYSKQELHAKIEESQAIIDCQITKVESTRATLLHENADAKKNIVAEPLLTDWLHSAAFRGNTLGFSRFTPDANIPLIKRQDLLNFQRAHHTPCRMVVAGVGVDHDELTALAERYFEPEDKNGRKKPVDCSLAQYTGGEVREEADLSEVGAGTPYPLLAHVMLGFNGCSYRDKDFVSLCVVQSLLGGGNSFSAGGPGKGMYTRLYTDVLNQVEKKLIEVFDCSHHWMYGCTAYNHSYADGGVFAVHSSCPPDTLGEALRIILEQFLRLTGEVEKAEFQRAKNQLKSQLLMNLEVRPVMFEDLARQVIGHGYRKLPEEYMDEIDAVKEVDIRKVAESLLQSRPSLVGYGNLHALPKLDALEEAVAKKDDQLLKPKSKLFSWQRN